VPVLPAESMAPSVPVTPPKPVPGMPSYSEWKAARAAEYSAPAPQASAPTPISVPPEAPKSWRDVGIENYYSKENGPTNAEWAKMGGSKAQRAWLESRNQVPLASAPSDVAAAVSRDASPEEILRRYSEARPGPKAAGVRGQAEGRAMAQRGGGSLKGVPNPEPAFGGDIMKQIEAQLAIEKANKTALFAMRTPAEKAAILEATQRGDNALARKLLNAPSEGQ